jgi:hypothetical protein
MVVVKCQVPTNVDGSAALPAGELTPEVYVNGQGYVAMDTSSATPVTVPFVVTSL